MRAAVAAGILATATVVAVLIAEDDALATEDAPCVTWGEYSNVELGEDNRAEVHRRFDFNGHQVWQGDGREVRKYRRCSGDGDHVIVRYYWDGDEWMSWEKTWATVSGRTPGTVSRTVAT
jgi:hypothetical protein